MENSDQFYTFRGYEIINREHEVLTPSMEDYLEMIYRIYLNKEEIRMNQLAKKLNVRVSSCTKIVQKLDHFGLVHYEKYANILLTEKGYKLGEFLLHRHEVLEKFLLHIAGNDTLLKDTELIEHYISSKLLRKLELLNGYFKSHEKVLKNYYKFVQEQEDLEEG